LSGIVENQPRVARGSPLLFFSLAAPLVLRQPRRALHRGVELPWPWLTSTRRASCSACRAWRCAFPSATRTSWPPCSPSTLPSSASSPLLSSSAVRVFGLTPAFRYLLDMPRVKHIVPDPHDPSMRLLLFSDAVTLPGAPSLLPSFLPSTIWLLPSPCVSIPSRISLPHPHSVLAS
jgi:hypothetical protein